MKPKNPRLVPKRSPVRRFPARAGASARIRAGPEMARRHTMAQGGGRGAGAGVGPRTQLGQGIALLTLGRTLARSPSRLPRLSPVAVKRGPRRCFRSPLRFVCTLLRSQRTGQRGARARSFNTEVVLLTPPGTPKTKPAACQGSSPRAEGAALSP